MILVCISFIAAVIFLSWLCGAMIQRALKRILDCGTEEWSGERAAKAYIEKHGRNYKICVKENKNIVSEFYDMRSNTLYLSPFSKNTYSLYNYTNALRQAVTACRIMRHKTGYALKMAILLVFRTSGVLAVIGLICAAIWREPFLLFMLAVEFGLFVLVELFQVLEQYGISREVIRFSVEHKTMDAASMKRMIQFNQTLNYAECAAVWKGFSSIVLLVPRIIKSCLQKERV